MIDFGCFGHGGCVTLPYEWTYNAISRPVIIAPFSPGPLTFQRQNRSLQLWSRLPKPYKKGRNRSPCHNGPNFSDESFPVNGNYFQKSALRIIHRRRWSKGKRPTAIYDVERVTVALRNCPLDKVWEGGQRSDPEKSARNHQNCQACFYFRVVCIVRFIGERLHLLTLSGW